MTKAFFLILSVLAAFAGAVFTPDEGFFGGGNPNAELVEKGASDGKRDETLPMPFVEMEGLNRHFQQLFEAIVDTMKVNWMCDAS